MFHICKYINVCVKNGTHVYLGKATRVLAVFKERTTASNMIRRCLCTSQHPEGIAKDLINCSLATMVCRKYCERHRYVCMRACMHLCMHVHIIWKTSMSIYNKKNMCCPTFEIERHCLLKEQHHRLYIWATKKNLLLSIEESLLLDSRILVIPMDPSTSYEDTLPPQLYPIVP